MIEKLEMGKKFYIEALSKRYLHKISKEDKGVYSAVVRVVSSPINERPLNVGGDALIIPLDEAKNFAGFPARNGWEQNLDIKKYLEMNRKISSDLKKLYEETFGLSIPTDISSLKGRILEYNPQGFIDWFRETVNPKYETLDQAMDRAINEEIDFDREYEKLTDNEFGFPAINNEENSDDSEKTSIPLEE